MADESLELPAQITRGEHQQLRARIAQMEQSNATLTEANAEYCKRHLAQLERIAQLEYDNESIKRGQSQVALLTKMNEKHIERLTAENQRLRADGERLLKACEQVLSAGYMGSNCPVYFRSAIDAARSE